MLVSRLIFDNGGVFQLSETLVSLAHTDVVEISAKICFLHKFTITKRFHTGLDLLVKIQRY